MGMKHLGFGENEIQLDILGHLFGLAERDYQRRVEGKSGN